MNASRASFTNASSHLVTSKHDAKCRRVPRIISRRLYCYRQKSALEPTALSTRNSQIKQKDFPPDFNDLTLGETVFNFIVKYPNRRSYSTDSDPLVQLRTKMNKTAYLNHSLMKRRYSVPETIMRKHKLQEILSKKVAEKPPKKSVTLDVKDESCQTDDLYDSRRTKKSTKRKRDGLRYFRKSNTYCQYKSFLSQKKKSRDIKSGSSATDAERTECSIRCQSSTSLPLLVEVKKASDDNNLIRQVSAPSSSEEFEKLRISEPSPQKCKTLHPLKPSSSVRQLSAPESDDICQMHSSRCHSLNPIRQSSAPSSSESEKHAGQTKYFESAKRVHIKNCKSLDQNTSGYNTICGSLDEYTTPRKKTPETSKVPIIEEQDDRKGKLYPISFHSESVFMHPCQEGFISHKEFHHISIQMVPEGAAEQQRNDAESKGDYYKTEIKMNVNDTKEPSANISQTEPICKGQSGGAHTYPNTPRDTSKQPPTRSSTPTIQVTETTPRQDAVAPVTSQVELFNGSKPCNEIEPYDCSVPTNYPFKSDKSNLKIEVDVGNMDIQSNLHDILLGHKAQNEPVEEPKPKHENKYNSKAALNYLFQKLGDSYPRRHTLKQPVFDNKPQFGKYYSELPKPEGSDIPPKVLYNNQTYDILSANLLPNEWSNVNPIADTSEHLSDSDISIPDSLEDFQQTKYKYNKYDKYDEKLTRGDVSIKTNAKPNKHKGVAYFIPLLDSNKTKPIMPAELRKKLCQRSENISKHSSCTEVAKKSPRNKFIHKQIQTCLNVDDSLKKRRKKFADAKDKDHQKHKTDRQGAELDEKIKNILLAGMNEDDRRDRYLVQHPSDTHSQSVQTENLEPVVTEYVEMFNMNPQNEATDESEFFNNDNLYEIILSEEEVGRINTNNFYRSFKKCRRIYYPNKIPDQYRTDEGHSSHSNIPTFSGYQRKLKEFKQQIKKQNDKGLTYSRTEATSELLPLPYPRMKKAREKPKSKSISKIPGPKRFYQKFEAIPEELSNSAESVLEYQENISGGSDENNESTPDAIHDDYFDVNDNLKVENQSKITNEKENEVGKIADENHNARIEHRVSSKSYPQDCENELKSQKGRDSLSIVNEQEELITLSKGWINFYLLKGNSTEDNSAPEDVDDENVALSETIPLPQQYTVHVHATPEHSSPTPKVNSTLPGLYKSRKPYKPEKTNQIQNTTLPDITAMPSSQVMNPIQAEKKQQPGQTNQLVAIHRDAARTENSISAVTTSSNHSESPSEEPSGRCLKKIQRYQRPHTYHSAKSTRGNQWSLTLKGTHNEKRPSADIEMQLSLKNTQNHHPSNHSWKFTLKSESTEMSRATSAARHSINKACLPHLNVNYKMLPSPTYQEENFTANFSENNSESNSTLSYSGRKYKLDSELLLQNVTRLNNDLQLQIRNTDDDLTVRGTAITPERKPRVPTMSERDLTRMRLIRQTSADNRSL